MFVIFYFLLIRPQQKKTKEHKQMIENLRKPLNPAEVEALDQKFHETLARYRSVMKDRKTFLLKNPAEAG